MPITDDQFPTRAWRPHGDATDNYIPRVPTPDDDLARAESRGLDVDGLVKKNRDLMRFKRRGGRKPMAYGFGPGQKGYAGLYKYDAKRRRLVRVA